MKTHPIHPPDLMFAVDEQRQHWLKAPWPVAVDALTTQVANVQASLDLIYLAGLCDRWREKVAEKKLQDPNWEEPGNISELLDILETAWARLQESYRKREAGRH